jgi:hypothetical protein
LPVPVDDVVLDQVATEGAPPPARLGGRGFWIVTAALAFASVFMVVEIFANFGTKDTIAHAEHSLDVAKAAADRIEESDGSYADADHIRLAAVEPVLAWVPGDEASTGLDQVSVATAGSGWGAAVQARPGACFYMHVTDTGMVLYGVGTVCTGQEALRASDPRW